MREKSRDEGSTQKPNGLHFEKQTVIASYINPDGIPKNQPVEIRIHPITGRSCRIAFSRIGEKEPGTNRLPSPPPHAGNTGECPFCRPRVFNKTPELIKGIDPDGRLVRGKSVLFPNLFPYGSFSGVSLFDNTHFVEIGTASVHTYRDSFLNCRDYLRKILSFHPRAVYMAITQNHLPGAGGSLIHPHLQVHADRVASNHHGFLEYRARQYYQKTRRYLFSDYLLSEKKNRDRYIGRTGSWEWVAAFAPEGFFEIWGILPGVTSLLKITRDDWHHLAEGVINTQKFYRNLCRNGYNLGILIIEGGRCCLEPRVVILARSNYDAWVRNDHTGYEVMLGDMVTFTAPEHTAEMARVFWQNAMV